MCDNAKERSEEAASCGSVDAKYMLHVLVMYWEVNPGVLHTVEAIML